MQRQANDSSKGVESSLWSRIKHKVLPPAVATGRMLFSMGGAAFSAEALANTSYRNYTGDSNASAPWALRVVLQFAWVVSTGIQNVFTTLPSIYETYGEPDHEFDTSEEPQGEAEGITSSTNEGDIETGNTTEQPNQIIGKWGRGIYIATKISLYLSVGFLFLNADFSGMNLVDMFVHAFTSTGYLSGGTMAINYMLGLYLAISNTFTNTAFTTPRQLNNFRNALVKLYNEGITFTTELKITLVVSALSLASTAAASYYSSAKMFTYFKKILPFFDNSFHDRWLQIPTVLSTFTGVVSEATSKPFALYRLIVKWRKPRTTESSIKPVPASDISAPAPLYWRILKMVGLVSSGVNAGFSGAQNYTNVPYLTNLNPTNPSTLVISSALGIAQAGLGYAFAWEGVNQTEQRVMIKAKSSQRSKSTNTVRC